MMNQQTKTRSLILIFLTFGSLANLNASELTIPNEFQANTPARASQVNANFSATATAVNDNHTRIAALESALTALTTRVATLESQPQSNVAISYDTFYATDLFFVRNDADGTIVIPTIDGNQSQAEIVTTNYMYYPVPGLNNISFNVANNGTTVIVRATGEAYLTNFSSLSMLEVAISVDGITPNQGAFETLRMVSDDNLSSGGASWDVTVPVQLDAGTHQFSVLIRGSNQNQSEISIDGRSVQSYPGKVKTSIMQIFDGN